MDPVLLVIGYTAFTGLTNVIGGVAGRFEHLRRGRFRSSVLHGLVAFGGGTMLAAVALVLLPEGPSLSSGLWSSSSSTRESSAAVERELSSSRWSWTSSRAP